MAIKLRRGNKADLQVSELQQGEPVVALDTKEFGIKGRENDMIWNVPTNRLIAGLDLQDDILLSELVTAGVVKGENLLHNWYFPNPVNQRGVSGTISTTGYFIDRWILTSGSVTLTSNGLTLNGTITQILEYAVGTDVTSSTTMYSGTATAAYNNSAKTFTITSSGGTIRAAKLEKGTVSTIANDAPPVSSELMLLSCRSHYIKIGNVYGTGGTCVVGYAMAATSTIAAAIISLPVTMRANPSIVISNFSNVILRNGQTDFAVTAATFFAHTANGLYFGLTSTGLTTGTVYQIRLINGETIAFDANL